jgi:hypothetical protein
MFSNRREDSKHEPSQPLSPGVVHTNEAQILKKEEEKSVSFHRFDSGDIAPPVKVKRASIKFYSPKCLVETIKRRRERDKVGCCSNATTAPKRFLFSQFSSSENFTESSLS